MKKLFLLVAFLIFPFSLLADETASSTVTVNVRYRDTLVFSGPVMVIKNSTANISDNTKTNRQIASDSALIALKISDDSSGDFNLSDLVYYADFNSLYVNCIDITSPPKHACANWQYVVNSAYPPVGMDKYILSGGDILYFYFGNPRRVSLSSDNAEAGAVVRARAESYDYVNNAWTVLSGAILGATQLNPADPYSPLVISSATSDGNGFADFVLGIPGSYNIGLAMDFYSPSQVLAVKTVAVPPEGSGPRVRPNVVEIIDMVEPASPAASATPETKVAEKAAEKATEKKPAKTDIPVKIDISIDSFIENYKMALQNQKLAAERGKIGRAPAAPATASDRTAGQNQLAGAAGASWPGAVWVKKFLAGVYDFFGFRK